LSVTLTQGAITVTLGNVQVAPVRGEALVAEHEAPGGDPMLQWMGRRALGLEVRGALRGAGAKPDSDKILSFLDSQEPVSVTYAAHGETWIASLSYVVTGYEYALDPGRPDEAGAVVVRYTIQLKRKV
jgi:hypothetical protein